MPSHPMSLLMTAIGWQSTVDLATPTWTFM